MPPLPPRRALDVPSPPADPGGVCRYATPVRKTAEATGDTRKEGREGAGVGKKKGVAEGLGLSKRSRRIERRARREKGVDMLADLVKKVMLVEKEREEDHAGADCMKGRGAVAVFGEWNREEEEQEEEDNKGEMVQGEIDELRLLIEKCQLGKNNEPAVQLFMPYIT